MGRLHPFTIDSIQLSSHSCFHASPACMLYSMALFPLIITHRQAKAEMRHGVHRICALPGTGSKTRAVAVATKKRSASDYTLRCIGRHPKFGVIAVGRPRRVYRCFTRRLTFEPNSKRVGTIPIGDPLPNIPGHIVESIGVRLVTAYRLGANFEFVAGSGHGKRLYLIPGIRHLFSTGREVIPPRIIGLFKTASCGVFPFSLGE